MSKSQLLTRRLFWPILFTAILLLAFAFYQFISSSGRQVTLPARAGGQSIPEWINVYYTNPIPPDDLQHGIDKQVIPEIDHAQSSIDVTSFDFNLPSVINALIRASDRGVRVRVVYDGVNGNLELNNAATNYQPFHTIDKFKDAGISLVNDGRSNGLMHNKFIIVDSKILFTGSWNLSYNDTFRNNNNLLKITDPKVIGNYQEKFDELFVDKKYGSRAIAKAEVPTLMIGETRVENYFSPADEVMEKIIAKVLGAKKSVHFMVYTFTEIDLASAMINQGKAGLDVQGVIESRCTSPGALPSLYYAKLPVKVDGNKYILHHKVIIIDRETVITGSYNFTYSAETYNDENILIIQNSAIASLFEGEYDKIYFAGKKPTKTDLECRN